MMRQGKPTLGVLGRFLLYLLLLLSSSLLPPSNAFTVPWPSLDVYPSLPTNRPISIIHLSRLRMGGYYSDPEVPLDQSDTHMVFGKRCLESRVVVDDDNAKPLVWLQPLQESDKENPDKVQVEVDHGPLLIDHIWNSWPQRLQGLSILEVGASSLSLTAVFALEAASVLTCHPDQQRLQIVEYTRQFFNTQLLQGDNKHGFFQTKVLKPEDPLPKANIIVFTMAGLDRLEEAVSSDATVLVARSIIPPTQLQDYRYEDSNDGVLTVRSRIR